MVKTMAIRWERLTVKSQEAVQAAFHQARVLEQTTARLDLIKTHEAAARSRHAELNAVALSPEMRVRLDEARGAAVGEAARLHQMIEQLVDTHEPLHTPPSGRGVPNR